jgi:cell division protein FtsB
MLFDRIKTGARVVKRRYSPRTKIVIAAVAAVVAIGGAMLIYSYGLSMAGFEQLSANRQFGSLRDENQKLKSENQELRDSLARAERALQMDQASYQELDNSLKGSAQEIVKLREELNFYRNIISPADKKAGLRIQNLDIEAAGTNKYRYKLVLIQALKHERTLYGTARLEIIGTQGGQDAMIRIPGPADKPLHVSLKYFQDIEGKIELPHDFKARQVKVNVTTSGGAEAVEAIYNWPEV